MNDLIKNLKELVEVFLIENSIKIKTVSIEWLDTSTVNEKYAIIDKIRIETESL